MKSSKNHHDLGDATRGLKVLLVDDNETFLATVCKTLRMLPHVTVVGQAHNGAQALELARQLQPDLMLLDIVMPGMTGLEVAKIMRTWPQSPKVLFLSMHDNESYRTAAKKIGALELVGKSNFVSELLPIIAALIPSKPEVKP